jgi:hypothetical protein
MKVDTIVQNQNTVVSVMAQVAAVVRGTDFQTQMPTLTLTLTADMDFALAQEAADPDTYSSLSKP